jgi:hypothetical protein
MHINLSSWWKIKDNIVLAVLFTFGVMATGTEMPRKNPNAAANNTVRTGPIAFIFILTHPLTHSLTHTLNVGLFDVKLE